MIVVNQDVANALTSPVRHIKAKVEFFKDSTLVETCHYTDRLISFRVERIGDTSKFFGFGICQKLNVHLIDKERELSFSTSHDIRLTYEVLGTAISPYPTFHISEVHRDENTNELSITAYDLMYPDTAHVISDMTLPASYNLLDFASAASTALKASGLAIENLADSSSFLLTLDKGGNFEGHETIREGLNDIAEATQTVYYINSNDKLVFKRLDKDATANLSITKSDYITLSSRTNRRLGVIYHTTELGDNLYSSTEAAGTTQFIRDNAFWSLLPSTEVATLLDNAIAAVGGLTINQFECSWRGNCLLEVGDKIDLTAKDNSIITAYILDDVIAYDGSLSEITQWSYINNDNETPATPTSVGDALNQTYAKVDKINKKIDLVASSTEGLPEQIASIKIKIDEIEAKVESLDMTEAGKLQKELASLKLTANSITQQIETMEQSTSNALETLTNRVSNTVTANDVSILIEQEMNDGVNSVHTETGYVFDKDGLTISKSGSEMSTQITEDGMTVSRDGNTVLTATSAGVNAVNLHATTYLIIGGTSRFEDFYDDVLGQRTGCFWIGE